MSNPETEKVTEPPKTEPAIIQDHRFLVGMLCSRIRNTLQDGGPDAASVLEWLTEQDGKVIREAIIDMQPKSWRVAAEPLTASLSEDQCRGVLAAMMAVFVQTL